MNFVSSTYLIFFLVVFFSYWQLDRHHQNLFLLVASYFFYANWDWRFLCLIIISTVVDYTCGRQIDRFQKTPRATRWLLVTIVVNLSILGYFKYANFFVDSFVTMLQQFGVEYIPQTTLRIILPVGISFYTFQCLSYSFDIYRGKLKASNSLLNFATFVAFFPQLVAGPIVRAKEFLFQLEQKRVFNIHDLEIGATRFLIGFFKKAVVADNLAIYVVDPVFQEPTRYTQGTLWLAVVAYSIQIYMDFSGYSNMAIGSAKILGFSLPENFKFPYLSTNFSDFWGRWHMTMSRFFRDYVYIGLGGSWGTTARTASNLFVTALASGLWHGSGWTFVLWGAIHGAFNSIYHLMRTYFDFLGRDHRPKIPIVLLGWLITQFSVCMAWVVFRASDFQNAADFYFSLFVFGGKEEIIPSSLVVFCIASFILDHLYGWLRDRVPERIMNIPNVMLASIYAILIIICFNLPPTAEAPFIYFQF